MLFSEKKGFRDFRQCFFQKKRAFGEIFCRNTFVEKKEYLSFPPNNYLNVFTMKKINAFDLTRLRIEEDFAFHQRIQQYAEDLPTTGALIAEGLPETSVTYLTTGVNTHKTAVEGLDSALKVSATVPSAKWVTEADATRDFAWTGLYYYVKAMTAHPDASVAAAAERALAILEKYGNPTAKPQLEESGILHNLLQELNAAKEAGDFTGLDIDPWMTRLETAESSFLTATDSKVEEEGARQVGISKQNRLVADDAYRDLVNIVNMLASMHGDEKFATFISNVNALVEQQRVKLKTRATNSAKKDEGNVIRFV